MQLLDLTLPTLEANLALEEALLDQAGQDPAWPGLLRLWEWDALGVVLGRSSQNAAEVQEDYCRRKGIPVRRRCSGGAAVVVGSGCALYAVIQRTAETGVPAPEALHGYVLGKFETALRQAGVAAERQGISDLAVAGCKISGNSLRCTRTAFLYHGTVLYNFPLAEIAACLRTAPRQPAYRQGRDHLDFVANVPLSREAIREVLRTAWPIAAVTDSWPQRETERLVRERYSQEAWNRR